MASLKEFFDRREGDTAKGVPHKNDLTKRAIVTQMAAAGECTLAELAARLNVSVPTATRLVGELTADGIVADLGKVETAGGRRPNIFGLAGGAACFAGFAIGRDRIDMALTDLRNEIVTRRTVHGFELADNARSLVTFLTEAEKFLADCGVDREKILAAGVALPGRVNPENGRSYRWFNGEKPLRDKIGKRLGLPVLLENDTRAQAYAEYHGRNPKPAGAMTAGAAQNPGSHAATAPPASASPAAEGVQDMIYVNIGRGFAIGIIAGGRLYHGKSGFAGEFGHTPFFDNNLICECGKRGCLETEVSGIAIENRMRTMIESGVNTSLRGKAEIHIDDIIDAARHDDTLSIELIEEAAEKAGKSVAVLLNIFNPELVVVGGNLARAGDYLMLPMQAAVNKHSVNLVYNDTRFAAAAGGTDAGAAGIAMMIRNKTIGLL